MHRNIPTRKDFFKQLRAIVINLGRYQIYLMSDYKPISYTSTQNAFTLGYYLRIIIHSSLTIRYCQVYIVSYS